MTSRRGFLKGLGLAIAAPAVIKIPGLLMPVKPMLVIGKPLNIKLIEPTPALEWEPIWLHKCSDLMPYLETDCLDDFESKGLQLRAPFRPMVIEPSHEVRSPVEVRFLNKRELFKRKLLNV